jgi:hypothetical protein
MALPAINRRALENIALAAIIILVGTASFGLGRLSVGKERVPARVIAPEGAQAAIVTNGASPNAASAAVSNGSVTASKNGTKYYTAGCSGAARISEANKVTFATSAEAEAAGYEKAAACK